MRVVQPVVPGAVFSMSHVPGMVLSGSKTRLVMIGNSFQIMAQPPNPGLSKSHTKTAFSMPNCLSRLPVHLAGWITAERNRSHFNGKA
ncbi:MAG: hypothetical protein ACLFRG_12735 [Desulfococcaceae bacterium]